MSVYIKGMDMPVDCLACRVACDKESYMVVGRPPKCPLAEAPDGDLIGRAETIEAVELMETFLGERKKNAVIRGIQALPSAETSQDLEKSIKALKGSDLISRSDAIEAVQTYLDILINSRRHGDDFTFINVLTDIKNKISALPSAEAKTKCVAQIKVDTEEVVSRIKEEYDITNGWIPCSERLPSDSGDYLVWLEDESEHYAVIPFDADAEDFGWWQDYYHPVPLGFLDSAFIKAENVTAWQSLPKPYREDGEDDGED